MLTGAVRPASEPGADGPANVRDAVAVAREAPAGAYIVFAGEVHAAARARKVDSTSPRAFGSPRGGPRGFAERDLRASGVVGAAHLSPQAARMRVLACLGAGLAADALRDTVARG